MIFKNILQNCNSDLVKLSLDESGFFAFLIKRRKRIRERKDKEDGQKGGGYEGFKRHFPFHKAIIKCIRNEWLTIISIIKRIYFSMSTI